MSNLKDDNKEEKHYTPTELMVHMNEEILKKYVDFDITEFLENSAGDGRMMDFLKEEYDVPVIGYDIKNETHREDIKECNYLKEDIPYKKGRVCFQNPPFTKGLKFIYKSLEECDYTISILSINSFLNINYDKYEVDTIDIFRKYDFGSCEVSICIVGIKKK